MRLTIFIQAPLQLWDQPTRGLDSKTALEFAETLRSAADKEKKSIAVTAYQAGNGIYDTFDKVLILADGHMIYYGPRVQAKSYFEDLGFVCPRGANIADFLTSVTVNTERNIAQGFNDSIPNTPEEFENVYNRSKTCKMMKQLLTPPESMGGQVEDLQLAVEREKRHRKVKMGRRSIYTAGLREQIINCTIR